MKNLYLSFELVLLLVLGMSGCGIHETKNNPNASGVDTEIQVGPDSKVSFSMFKQDILIQSCQSCHLNGMHRGGVALDTYPQVIAHLSDIESDMADGSMPQDGSLTSNQIALFKLWISQGAPNTVAEGPAATPVPDASPVASATPTATVAPTPTLTPLVPNFQSIKDHVFAAKCLQCHTADGEASDYPLDTYATMIAVNGLVVKADSEKSSLVAVIEKNKMPPKRANLSPVTADELAIIKLWINNGATQ
jgi:uncharacterized membrane protein